MRTVSEILKVAERDYYQGPASGMCSALWHMKNDGRISFAECKAVSLAILEYMEDLDYRCAYLDHALESNGLPYDEAACRAIYRDWNNRPRP